MYPSPSPRTSPSLRHGRPCLVLDISLTSPSPLDMPYVALDLALVIGHMPLAPVLTLPLALDRIGLSLALDGPMP